MSLWINLCAGRQDKDSKKWDEKKTSENARGLSPAQHSDPYQPEDPYWHNDDQKLTNDKPLNLWIHYSPSDQGH